MVLALILLVGLLALTRANESPWAQADDRAGTI